MDTYKTGKIYKILKENGVGYIVDDSNMYLFTVNDSKEFELLEVGDIVRFRAEKVNNEFRAFFVKKKNKKPID